eukprot:3776953-Prymnesium_polylepis.2
MRDCLGRVAAGGLRIGTGNMSKQDLATKGDCLGVATWHFQIARRPAGSQIASRNPFAIPNAAHRRPVTCEYRPLDRTSLLFNALTHILRPWSV